MRAPVFTAASGPVFISEEPCLTIIARAGGLSIAAAHHAVCRIQIDVRDRQCTGSFLVKHPCKPVCSGVAEIAELPDLDKNKNERLSMRTYQLLGP